MLRPVMSIAIVTAGMFGGLLAAPVMAQDAETVVATVNGEAITLGQMIAMKQGMGAEAVANLPDAALWDLMLDQMLRQTAVAQLRSDKLTAGDKAALEIDRRAYLAGAAMEGIGAAEATDEELRGVYDSIFGNETEPKTEYNAAHILVETEDEAKEIAKELADGADFGALAGERSTDNSAPNKGDLGWFQSQQMVAPFAEAVETLSAGEISEPVETQFGWHIVKLIDSREVDAPSFDEIKDQLALQVRRNRVDTLIEDTTKAATIEKTEGLDPDLLNKTDLLEK